jgi:N-methylhydantoinase A
VGAVEVARVCGFDKALTFDMGGTSTDVALAGQQPRLTTEARIDHYPVRVPMLDIHTVGAGGGSIATVDAGGSLRVGPESAGADPGPACYGAGDQATVTDAHVVLGRIAANQLTGGGMRIDAGAAERAVDRVAKQLGLGTLAAAEAIVRVANSNMERAIRTVSVERGEDPRDFPLVAFGGCGGLHACELAGELEVGTVIVPQEAGALSALGMLMADRVRDYSTAVLGKDPGSFEARFRQLCERAEKDVPGARMEMFADVRYAGQSYELTVGWGRDFHAEHHRIYGYSNAKRATQVVTLRVRAVLPVEKATLGGRYSGVDIIPVMRRVWIGGRWHQIPTGPREAFLDKQGNNRKTHGPVLITDYGSTTLVPENWSMYLDESQNLVLKVRTVTAAG